MSCFEPLGRRADVQLFSLQKDTGLEQLAAAGERFNVMQFGEDFDRSSGPFMDTAAVMSSLDLVITCDTVHAHLAGALGVPTWLALSYTPDWRWMLDRSDSPWYPSLRLFRQTQFGDWDGVFQRICQALDERIDSGG